eukprot:GFUD01104402.1.p2 GENE.GFUD01104402.1~~GFUD01104402.1.p2  ORF type:complete len:115 (+),score=39.10 GFUD01104402.1:242-586(+)
MVEPMMAEISESGWTKEDQGLTPEVVEEGEEDMETETGIMETAGVVEVMTGETGATLERETGGEAGADLTPGTGGEKGAGAIPGEGGTGIGVAARIGPEARAGVKKKEIDITIV